MTSIWLTFRIAIPIEISYVLSFFSIFENVKSTRENAGNDTARANQNIFPNGQNIAMTFGTGEGFLVTNPTVVKK